MYNQAKVATTKSTMKNTVKNTVMITVMITAFTFSLFAGQIPVAQAAGVNFERVDTEVRGSIGFGTLAHCQEKVYTPVSDADGKLRLIHSSLVGNNLAPLPQNNNAHVAGAITEVDIARIDGCNYFVTATRDSSSMVKLVAWFSGANGIERLGDSGNHGMAATELAFAGVGYPLDNESGKGYVVRAARAAGGNLVMSSWSVNEGTFNSLETVIDEPASQIAMATLPPRPEDDAVYAARIVTAFKDASGNLKLVLWHLDDLGGIHRIADSGNQAGNVQQISIAQYANNEVITAVKNSDGNLQMVPWMLHASSIDRLEGDGPEFNNPFAGAVQEIDITAIDFAHPLFDHVVTAVRTAEGNLRLIVWGIDTAGNVARRGSSENLAGTATKINVEWSQTASRIITSMRDGEGNLRIVAWRVFP